MDFIAIGVDCATDEARTGLAFGVVPADGRLELRRATLGTAGESAAATVAGWIAGAERYVIGFDAPLGWPSALASALAQHRAGEYIAEPADRLFRRDTDRFVHQELGKQPLAVGADRIAHTARAALGLLAEIRATAGKEVPLAWSPGKASGAIEVYPAATLASRGIASRGYKGEGSERRKARAAILERLRAEIATELRDELLIDNDHLLDAVLCALAAADFARGEALAPEPEQREIAEREGWIWFRGRGQRRLL